MTRGVNDLNVFRFFTRSFASQDFARRRNCLQRNVIDFSGHRRNVATRQSRNGLPFSIHIHHGFQILRHTLRTPTTGGCQFDLGVRRQQHTHQGLAIGLAFQVSVGSCQEMLAARQGHTVGSRSRPVSVLTGLSTCEITTIRLGPQEVLGGNHTTSSLGSRHLGPTSGTINRT